ncbi:MAG: glycine cleavage system aminomethyltransferase GcvT [Pseudomonadota bacterium]
MTALHRTVFFRHHTALGATMVPFGGWQMPVQYPGGIIQEHLATRKGAGLFDVSHMGRFVLSGKDALPMLQHTLTNNAAALEVGESHYTLIPDANGGAIDDAYLYRFTAEAYLLVVNASNREKDWAQLSSFTDRFPDMEMTDQTLDMAMLSLQGPAAKEILTGILDPGAPLPDPMRNALGIARAGDAEIWIGRTGYTGEPLCFELFFQVAHADTLWQKLLDAGAVPVGLGARDTLRLEAALPLYGHELGDDAEGRPIPLYASGLSRFAVSFSPLKGDYIGRSALARQFAAFKKILDRDYSAVSDLPRRILPFVLEGKGVARAGCPVLKNGAPAGAVTSGTMVPYWQFSGEGIASAITGEKAMRAVGLALVDSHLADGDRVEIDIRGRRVPALLVPHLLRSEAPPFARPITCYQPQKSPASPPLVARGFQAAERLVANAVENHQWRQRECINLIPSEMTPSRLVAMLSITDPVGRYAEHKPVKAFCDSEVFYYQGTHFIAAVEAEVRTEMAAYLGCTQVETRPISGQMANMALFSAMVDHRNRADRKREQARMQPVMNHHIIRGGHLSAQPMGALRDYVARDPRTEKPAVVNFPVLADNPYQIDIAACRQLMAEHRPEFIILGKSMILHREPVADIRAIVSELELPAVILYDMAHVLGLVGPHFQQPFAEGADIVTGSTHKTFFGPQRGIIAANVTEADSAWELWEAIGRRSFPGSTSNHHPGTLLALLMALHEMNTFKADYQPAVIKNAKAFAAALADLGMTVAGDPAIGFTETHQVILEVGYARGPEIARRLEENNIIVNYQATPQEEGFTASGALRMGVAEMTRFGMAEEDFRTLAQLLKDIVVDDRSARAAVADFRKRFQDMRYCFDTAAVEPLIQKLHRLI